MRKKSGFTIIEVLIAMFILISAVYVLSNLQIRAMFRVLKDRSRVDRIFLIKKELYTLLYDKKKQEKKITVKLEDPEVSITTQPLDIDKKSALHDMCDDINLVIAKGEWQSNTYPQELAVVSLVPKRADEKEQK